MQFSASFMPDNATSIIFTVLSGLFWTIAYVNIIYRGIKDKTAGMPLMVLGLNISWEFLFSVVFDTQIMTQRIVNFIWFMFDIGIVILKFKYGRDEFRANLPGTSEKLFYPYLVTIIGFSFLCVFFSVYEWKDYQGAYSAYIMNVFISALYISMLKRKGSTDGQSMYIAIFKCIGTLTPDILGFITVWNKVGTGIFGLNVFPLVKILIEICIVFDITYIIMLYKTFKREGKNPWTRKPLAPVETKIPIEITV